MDSGKHHSQDSESAFSKSGSCAPSAVRMRGTHHSGRQSNENDISVVYRCNTGDVVAEHEISCGYQSALRIG